ncbi:hypothetical protein TNCT_83651 [Trichonephila clavata]|uniref:Uncharacterized protein n=1 Tax=Trichonephila clavata TaxID=2740835 RepID=A0A8X6GGQ8_TRICU|nr:hypothetical protein TNCT_83651 [Trichonephila clavata]
MDGIRTKLQDSGYNQGFKPKHYPFSPLAVQVMIEDLGKIIAVPMGVNNSEAEIRGAIEYNESIVLYGSRVDIWEI